MEINKTILAIIISIVAGLYGYTINNKNEKISELEKIISQNNMYPNKKEILENYLQNRDSILANFESFNDSLSIKFEIEGYGKGIIDDLPLIKMNGSLTSKLKKEIDYIMVDIILLDPSEKRVLDMHIRKEIENKSQTVKWGQSWNLKRYNPKIEEIITSQDLNDFSLKWTVKQVVFKDKTSIIIRN